MTDCKGIPLIFQNCTDIFRCGTDEKYAECNNDSSPDRDECNLLKDLHDAKDYRKYFFAIIPLILSVIAIFLNILFVSLVVSLIMKSRKGSRKRYAFLLNRSICTIIALCLFYIVLIAWKFNYFNYISATVFIGVATLTFLNLTGTYLAMTTILYTAVIHPLLYKSYVTMTRSLFVILGIWIFSGVSSIFFGMLSSTLFYPETSPIKCDYNSCQWPLALALVITLSVCYSSVIICYALMVLRIRLTNPARISPTTNGEVVHQVTVTGKASRSSQNSAIANGTTLQRNMRVMHKLAWNLITFAISKSPLVAISLIALINLDELRKLGMGKRGGCKTYNNGKLFLKVEILASSAANIWLFGMLFDPLINIVNDPPLWLFVRHYLRPIKAQICGIISRKNLSALRGRVWQSTLAGSSNLSSSTTPKISEDDNGEF